MAILVQRFDLDGLADHRSLSVAAECIEARDGTVLITLRGQQLVQRLTEHFVGAITQYALGGRVPVHQRTAVIDHDQRIQHGCTDRFEFLFAGRLCLLAGITCGNQTGSIGIVASAQHNCLGQTGHHRLK